MQIPTAPFAADSAARSADFENDAATTAGSQKRALMWLNEDRVVYIGLIGAPSVRTFGAHSVYVSLTLPHHISIDRGPWRTTHLSAVAPNVPHRIVGDERMIGSLLVESDTVALAAMPTFMRAGIGAVSEPALLLRIRAELARFQSSGRLELCTDRFDEAFFGERLSPRSIDRRIGQVIMRIKREPNEPHSADDCAALIHVSVSRLLHLFKAEVGVPFRSFRTWQRARSVLYYVTQRASLATIALDAGYPDSTHFSHSVRSVYGLTPKLIFAGCRRLDLYRSRTGH